jgi:hypothetical protein
VLSLVWAGTLQAAVPDTFFSLTTHKHTLMHTSAARQEAILAVVVVVGKQCRFFQRQTEPNLLNLDNKAA